MTKEKVMKQIVEHAALAAAQGELVWDGAKVPWSAETEYSGQEFVTTSMFSIATVCAASGFSQEEVKSLSTEAIEQGYKAAEDNK
jgi:hypothetical protein